MKVEYCVVFAFLLAACSHKGEQPSSNPAVAGMQASTPAAPSGNTSVSGTAGGKGAPEPQTSSKGTPQAGAAGGTADSNAAGAASGAANAGQSGVEGFGGQAGTKQMDGVSREPLASRSFEFTREKITDAPIFNVLHPTDLSSLEGPAPVIVWANGGCMRSDLLWRPLLESWAKVGFVVLSLSTEQEDVDPLEALATGVRTTSMEHRALIDWVVAQNQVGSLAGKLDVTRVVAAGNSCGGVTALESAAADERIAAVFVLSGSSASGSVSLAVMKAIKRPTGYVVGSEDEDIAAPNAKGDYEAIGEGIPAMLVNRFAGDHGTVSGDPMITPQVAAISVSWFDLTLYGNAAAYDALLSPNVCVNCPPGDWKLVSKNLETLRK